MSAIKITSAKYLEDYKISFEFSNGKKTVVDFGYFILTSKSAYVKPFRDLKKFKKFEINNGHDISWKEWDEYDMCFEFKNLYKGGVISPVGPAELKRTTIAYFGKKKAEKMFAEAGY